MLRVNRGYSDSFEWKAVDDVDSLITAGNTAPLGIWSDETTMWVVDRYRRRRRQQALRLHAGGQSDRDSDKDIDLPSDNSDAVGIWSDGTTMWVVDTSDRKLFAYTLSNGNRDSSKDINLTSANFNPEGIWSDETTMWVVDNDADDKVYAYTLSTGKPADEDKDIDLTSVNFDIASGIWSDGETVWVSGQIGGNARVRAYRPVRRVPRHQPRLRRLTPR